MYRHQKNGQKEWKTYNSHGKVHFFYYFEIWKIKTCTLTRKAVKSSEKHTFSSEGYIFLKLFWNLKNSKKNLYEKNSQKEWKTYIFLGGVHFFNYLLTGTIPVTIFFIFFLFFSRYPSGHYFFFTIFFRGTVLVTIFLKQFVYQLIVVCFPEVG